MIPADDHSTNDGSPAFVEHLVHVLVAVRNDAPERSEREEEDHEEGTQPLLVVCKENN